MKSKKHVISVQESFVRMTMMKIMEKKKVKYLCHYTWKFRGAAHSICNLRSKGPKDIPIIIVHNDL